MKQVISKSNWLNIENGELPTGAVPQHFYIIETDRTKAAASYLDHIQREASPRIIKSITKEYGCNYNYLDNGGMTWESCGKHEPGGLKDK